MDPVPPETRDGRGDRPDKASEWPRQGERLGAEWVACRRGGRAPRGGDAPVRQVFHRVRSTSIEPFYGLVKGVIEGRVKRTVKGLERSRLRALGAVVLCHLVLGDQHERGRPLGRGITPLWRAA